MTADRAGRPAWGWRSLAWAVLAVGVLALPSLPTMGPLAWTQATANWIAVAGTFAYAYGRPPRRLGFWRVFALLFSFSTVATLGQMIGRVFTIGRDAPAGGWVLVAATLAICIAVCVALLRHSELLRGRQGRINREYERIFA